MSSNNKSDMSNSGSESPLFSTGPRGAAFLEKPGSSRESIANRIQSSALGTTRSAAATSVHGDNVALVQSIIADVKPVIPAQSQSRPAEMRQMVRSLVANISDELGSGRHAEDFKRTRSKLVENVNKAGYASVKFCYSTF